MSRAGKGHNLIPKTLYSGRAVATEENRGHQNRNGEECTTHLYESRMDSSTKSSYTGGGPYGKRSPLVHLAALSTLPRTLTVFGTVKVQGKLILHC